ncbi:MAG: ferrous iron transport protein A [Butyrivibrio sp.]|uniref:FeoA family protein n=1 Tax=Butyrivibrio sp. FCS014 TaxID=1408304 RepID=UPI0004639AAC|nr:FeoA family protein [Butyrivibrio sp. FCS014]MCR5156224.1 ferrous iron transport protein A [Butyrivibrio sp.]
MMPLTMADNGKLVKIQKITGTDEIKQHMATLGFVVGEEVTIVNKNGGNLIVNVKDSRIALDKSLANRILI